MIPLGSKRAINTTALGIAATLAVAHATIIPSARWLVDAILNILSGIFNAITGILMWLIAQPIETLVTPPPPGQIIGIGEIYTTSVYIFFGSLATVLISFYGISMYFPEKAKGAPERALRRGLFASIAVVVLPLFFDFTVLFTNAIIDAFILPESYSLEVDASSIEGFATVALSGVAAFIFAIIFSLGTIVTYLVFLCLLVARAVLIASLYGLLPVLLLLWVVDIGPLKYGNTVATMAFKVLGVFIIMGFFLALSLAIGAALVSADGAFGGELVLEEEEVDDRFEGGVYVEEESGTAGSIDATAQGEAATEESPALVNALIRLFVYPAAIWGGIVLTKMTVGQMLSVGVMNFARKGKVMEKKFKKAVQKNDRGKRLRQTINDSDSIPVNLPDDRASVSEKTDQLKSKADDYSGGKLSSGKESIENTIEGGTERVESVTDRVKSGGQSAKQFGDKHIPDHTAKTVATTAATATPKAMGTYGKMLYAGLQHKGAKQSVSSMADVARESPLANPNQGGSEGSPTSRSEAKTELENMSELGGSERDPDCDNCSEITGDMDVKKDQKERHDYQNLHYCGECDGLLNNDEFDEYRDKMKEQKQESAKTSDGTNEGDSSSGDTKSDSKSSEEN